MSSVLNTGISENMPSALIVYTCQEGLCSLGLYRFPELLVTLESWEAGCDWGTENDGRETSKLTPLQLSISVKMEEKELKPTSTYD